MYSKEPTRLIPRGVMDDACRMLGSQGVQEVAFLARNVPDATRLLPNEYFRKIHFTERSMKPDLHVSLANLKVWQILSKESIYRGLVMEFHPR